MLVGRCLWRCLFAGLAGARTNTNSKGVEKVRNAFSAGVNAYGIVKGVGGVLKLWLQKSSVYVGRPCWLVYDAFNSLCRKTASPSLCAPLCCHFPFLYSRRLLCPV